jgi:ELWxxDGT repeat protein
LIEFPIWPTDPVALGEDRLIFATSNDSVARLDLWVSDGTSENTTHLKKFVWPDFTSWPITPNVRIANLTAAGDLVYFTAGDEEHGNELWRTDGTIEGTRLVSDIVLGPISSDPGNLATVGERLYFTASNGDGAPNDEIWTTDGTGTRRLFDFDEGWPNCRYSRFDGCYPETGVGFFPTSHGILIPYNDDRYGNELFVLSGELPPLGDVGGDGAVNSLDIDELQYTIRETYEYDAWWGTSYPFRDTSAVFDLNFDVVVDEQDVDWLVEEILKTRRGDLNLDRKVDFADFLMLSANFGMTNATWAMGDIDGDGAVLENDFAILRDAFGSSPSVTVGVAVSRT